MRKEKKLSLRLQAFMISISMLLTFIMPIKGVFAMPDENDKTGNTDIVRTLSLSYKLKGSSQFTNLESPYEIPDITKIQSLHAKYGFEIKDNEIDGAPNRTVKSGDYYMIDLPDKLKIINPADGSILGNGGRPIANYSFINKADGTWQVKVQFTDYVDDPNEFQIHGSLEFDFSVDLSAVGEGTTTTVSIPIDNNNNIDIDITKPVPPPTTPAALTKTVSSYNDQTRELVWNVKMLPDTGIFGGCVFTDTIDVNSLDLKSIKHGNVTLTEGTDYTYDSTTGKITYTIPQGRDGAAFQNIVITTAVKRSIYGRLLTTTIENTANLSGGASYVDINSNTAAQTITPNWLGKSGTLFQGNKIKWTIDANITNQAMYNAVITDNFQNDVTLDKNTVYLGSALINVYDGSHTAVSDTEVYGIYTTNGDGTSKLQIYLPRGQANASNAKQTVTLVTSIVSPSSKGAQDPVYNNTAALSGNYITDGSGEGIIPDVNIGQIGVAVPYLSVVKGHLNTTEDDKRNGTITWTIGAASNLSNYGKSQIADTLPDDQDYIKDEIYWGSTKIDETTEPKAEISADGRTLTITFNSNKALQAQQNFTVKTKIKQDIYGTNINRKFTNSVTGSLFSTENQTAPIVTSTANDSVQITNTVISKISSAYNGNDTKQGQNPRVNFSIAINSNLMPLNNVVITDDLNKIATEFKKSGDSSFAAVSGVNWSYVTGTLKITKNTGTRDSLDLAAIATSFDYTNNVITVNFGSNTKVNDKYTITFTAELNVSQNDIFKNNGTIRCKGNIGGISADGLKPGTISTPGTVYSNEIKNEVIGKYGTNLTSQQQVLWTINLNQHRAALDSNRVVDVLPKGLTLDPTSIKLYKNVIGTGGNFVTGSAVESQGTSVPFDYTYIPASGEGMEGRYTITATLPDNSTDYILRFATDIDSSILGTSISNSAYYAEESSQNQNSSTSAMTLSSTSGGGSTTKTSITVNKLSKDNGDKLTGAIFALYWLKNGSEPVFVRTQTVTNGSAIFRGLTKGEKYTLTEVTQPNGYLLDNKDPVEIDVPLTGTGDIPALTFYDTPVKTGSWTPTAIKKLDGKSIIHSFNFEILDGSSEVMTGVTKDKLPDGSFSVKFSMKDGILPENITNFTDSHIFSIGDPAGTEYLAYTRTFSMKETALPGISGYSFDNRVQDLIVKVYNVKGQADLKVVVEDDKGNVLSDNSGKFNPDKIPVFQNTYRAKGSILLSAEKKLTGHSLAAEEFSFELYDGSTLIQTAGNKAGTSTGAKTYTGSIDFSPINYNQSDVGTKTYTIKEKDTALAGYTYDKAIYTIDVKITDNDDGTLTSTVQSIRKTVNDVTTDENSVSFNNTYTTSNIDVNLGGTKILSGRTLEDGQFSFKISQVNPEGALIKELGTVSNNGEDVNFPKLTFNQDDIGSSYYYQVKEVSTGKAGYTYDNSVYTVKIDVLDNDDGTLRAVQTITKDGEAAAKIVFSNAYNASGKIQIAGTKTLTGKSIAKDQFSFALQQTDVETDIPIGERITVKNDAEGNVIFPELTYDQSDAGKDFYYKVWEINEGIGGYTYDSNEYTICISVSDNGDGTLKVQKRIITPKNKTGIIFENSYVASNTSLNIKASKVLIGGNLKNQQFTFVLNEVTETGTFIKEIQKVKNAENGSVIFAPVIYTQADMGKTYYYQISEIDENDPDYKYDNSVYTIKVNVIDNGNGTLKPGTSVIKNAEVQSLNAEKIEFVNKYLKVEKTGAIIDEETQKPIGGAAVIIKDKDGNVIEETTTDENGNFKIPELPIGEKVTVIVKKDGYKDKTYEIEITDDQVPIAEALVKSTSIPKTGSEYYNILMLGAVMFLITSYLIYNDGKKRKAIRK